VEDSSDGYLLELAAPLSHDRDRQIHNPVDVVAIRGQIVPQLRRVIVQNLVDGREAGQEAGAAGVLQHFQM
jgi:hypothetical protein